MPLSLAKPIVLPVVILTLGLTACGRQTAAESGVVQSQTRGLMAEQEPGVLVYRNPSTPLSSYTRLYIPPAQRLSGSSRQEGAGLDPAQQLRREIVARLTPHFQIVHNNGAGVARLECAIIGGSDSLETSRLEMVLTDSVTGRVLLALNDRRQHPHQAPDSDDLWIKEHSRKVLEDWAETIRRQTRP